MRAKILEPADVSGTALAELKTWLGISRSNEDLLLTNLLQASIAMCEAYTGQAPLAQLVEERIPAQAGRYDLMSRPIIALDTVESISQDGSRETLDPEKYELDLQPTQCGTIRVSDNVEEHAIAVILQVGISTEWTNVPAAIKQGLIRLAAFQYRDRDRNVATKAAPHPPASVVALWRPWREVRLK